MKSDRKAAGLVEVNVARFSAEIDTELFNRAEKELAAFVAAVHTLHGEEQARTASNGWLLELIALKEPCKCAFLDLRAATIGAARRLTQRLSVPSARHAVLAVTAGILLLAAPANAQAVASNSSHSSTQDKQANLDVIRWRSISGKHEFQQDSDHPSRNSNMSISSVQFTSSCLPSLPNRELIWVNTQIRRIR